MSRYLMPVLILLPAISAFGQEPDASPRPQKPGYLKWLAKGNFTTLLESQGTYQVRVLNGEQKVKAEAAAVEYVKQRAAYNEYLNAMRRRDRGAFAPADGAPEPEPPAKVDPPGRIAADLADGTFFEIADVASDYVELTSGDTHVILPVASIRVILIGEKGGLSTASRPSSFSSRTPLPEGWGEPFRGGRGE
jgi:hypothetical protein